MYYTFFTYFPWLFSLIILTSFFIFKKYEMNKAALRIFYITKIYIGFALIGGIIWLFFKDHEFGMIGKNLFFAGMLCGIVPVYFQDWIQNNVDSARRNLEKK